MSALTNQVLVRNESLFTQGKWLIANAPDADIFASLAHADNQLFGFHQRIDVHEQACQRFSEHQHFFGAGYEGDQDFDGIIVYAPKAKAHARMLIADLANRLKPDGLMMMVGENKEGIKSTAKLMSPLSDTINKIDAARHCSLFCAQLTKPIKAFDIKDWEQTMSIRVGDLTFDIVSLPGVFSHGELDPGTLLLLENCGDIDTGKLLDFACGAGVIGVYLGLRSPTATITLSDVSALALHCTKRSVAINHINGEVIASSGLANLAGKFNAIYTNPPFHTGAKTDYSITEQFIHQAKGHLFNSGALVLVANRFLKYPEALEQRFNNLTVLAKTTKFALFRCINR